MLFTLKINLRKKELKKFFPLHIAVCYLHSFFRAKNLILGYLKNVKLP